MSEHESEQEYIHEFYDRLRKIDQKAGLEEIISTELKHINEKFFNDEGSIIAKDELLQNLDPYGNIGTVKTIDFTPRIYFTIQLQIPSVGVIGLLNYYMPIGPERVAFYVFHGRGDYSVGISNLVHSPEVFKLDMDRPEDTLKDVSLSFYRAALNLIDSNSKT